MTQPPKMSPLWLQSRGIGITLSTSSSPTGSGTQGGSKVGAVFAAVLALFIPLFLHWARSIFRPVEQMNQAMQRVEEGDAAARVGPVAALPEIREAIGRGILYQAN